MKFLTPKVRRSLYALGVAVFGVLGAYGVTSDDQARVLMGALGAALNVMAALNVSEDQ